MGQEMQQPAHKPPEENLATRFRLGKPLKKNEVSVGFVTGYNNEEGTLISSNGRRYHPTELD